MRIAPRVTILVLVGIVIYVSLSLYHWRQVKKIPDRDTQKTVKSVLKRDSHEKNWVQVSTTSEASVEKDEETVQAVPVAETSRESEQKPAAGSLPASESTLSAEGIEKFPSSRDLQPGPDENTALRKTLEDERKLNEQQSARIKDLLAQVITLQSTLEETSADLEQKERALEEQKKKFSLPEGTRIESRSSADQVQSLKVSLGSKIDALAKANERIAGLSEKLDQSRRTAEDVQSSNVYLQSVLAETEAEKINASQQAKIFHQELVKIRDEKEQYLAEIGLLHTELQQTKSQLARMANELGNMQLKTEAMLRYGEQQTELITPFRQEIEILNARVDDKKIEILDAEDLIDQLQDQNNSLQKEVLAMKLEQQKNEHISKELKFISQNLKKEQKHSSELSEQLKELAGQLNNRDDAVNILKNELTLAHKSIEQAKQQKALLQEENKQQQLHLEKSALAEKELQQQLERAKADIADAQARLSLVSEEKNQLTLKVADHAQQLKMARNESAELALQVEETNKQLAAAVQVQSPLPTTEQGLKTEAISVQNKKDESSSTEESIETLKRALGEAETRLAETVSELQQLREAYAEAKHGETEDRTNLKLQNEIDELRNTLAENEQQQKNMTQLVEGLEEKNAKLRQERNEAVNERKNIQTLKAAAEKKIGELEDKQKRINSLLEEKTNLESELDRRETDFFAMQEEYSLLQHRFESLQQERDKLFRYTLDSDNDGVKDADDNCPETMEKSEVGADGCEFDRDRDGLVDRLDLCPESSEQTGINPLGCSNDRPIILSGLSFSAGNAELSAASQSYLDKIAAALKQSKEIHVEVGGHTDSIGEIAWNKILSRKRAEAVTGYLSEKGIDKSRLTPVGYGSEQPIADNAIASGRAANRRVELKIVTPEEKLWKGTEKAATATAEEEDLPVR